MQKKLWAIGLLAVFAAAACNNPGTDSGAKTSAEQNPCGLSAKDSAFIAGWNRFSHKTDSLLDSKKDVPVPRPLADECIAEYKRVYGGTQPVPTSANFTDYVAFNTGNIRKWIEDNDIFNRSNYIVIQFGIYTQNVVTTLHLNQHKVGRMTAFISPYLVLPTDATATQPASAGTPATRPPGGDIDPYNLGSLNP